MTKALALIIAISFTIVITISCKKDNGGSGGGGGGGGTTVDCSTVTNKAFAANVNPIIQASCNVSGCHAAGSTNGPGPLTNYAQISAASIRSAISSGSMPKGSTLTAAQKNSIICWIDSGKPNN